MSSAREMLDPLCGDTAFCHNFEISLFLKYMENPYVYFLKSREISPSRADAYTFRQLFSFQSTPLPTRTHQSWLTCCRNYFSFRGFCSRTACPDPPPQPPSCVVYIFIPFAVLRPDVAVHQPGHPHLHRVLGDPQGAWSPLLQDPVPHPGRTQHLRALGKSLMASVFSVRGFGAGEDGAGEDGEGGAYMTGRSIEIEESE